MEYKNYHRVKCVWISALFPSNCSVTTLLHDCGVVSPQDDSDPTFALKFAEFNRGLINKTQSLHDTVIKSVRWVAPTLSNGLTHSNYTRASPEETGNYEY